MKRGKADYWVHFRAKDTRTFRTGRKAWAVYFSDQDAYCLVRFTGKKKISPLTGVRLSVYDVWEKKGLLT
jgi:hypothetical protein